MTRITQATARLIDIPVETPRSDAIQSFQSQETPIVELRTDDGLTGIGYSYTIGTGGTSVIALLRDHLLPALIGQDARSIEGIWASLYGATRATTTGAITSLALAAVDTALWDLRGQRAGEPLWQTAGGHRRETPMYDTEGGWLHLGIDELVENAAAVATKGWRAAKIKVGKPDVHEDLARLAAVREAVGDSFTLMIDANQGFTVSEAIRRAAMYERFDIAWLEEPLPADDVEGHAQLARQTRIPIAVGESLYGITAFRNHVNRGGASIIQVDAARIGGITPWLKVAHLAEANNLEVCPHFLMELHVSLTAAIPNGRFVEYIPQLTTVTRSPMATDGDRAIAPDTPGLGIDWDLDRLDDLTVA